MQAALAAFGQRELDRLLHRASRIGADEPMLLAQLIS
jgi:hypothetical protein